MSVTEKFKKQLDTATPKLNRPHHQAEKCALICKEFSIGFAEWVVDNHKQYPNAILRFDKLFDFYEKQQEDQKEVMIPPKEKANELYKKVGMLLDLKHNEILEVLDFLLETKTISSDISLDEIQYWELVRIESKKIK